MYPSPTKKARTVSPSFYDIPASCRLDILGFLTLQEIYFDYARVSSVCLSDTQHSFIPPILIISQQRQLIDVIRKLMELSPHIKPGTHLIVKGHASFNMSILKLQTELLLTENKITNIVKLDLSIPQQANSERDRKVYANVVKVLSSLLPNLKEVDCSFMRTGQSTANDLCKHCPRLERFKWNHPGADLFLIGQDFKQCKNLKELYLDHASFFCTGNTREVIQNGCTSNVLFCDKGCHDLERVSIRKCKYFGWCGVLHLSRPEILPQSALIEYVRWAKKLRWFRSDLSKQNIEMLKRERREVCFVS